MPRSYWISEASLYILTALNVYKISPNSGDTSLVTLLEKQLPTLTPARSAGVLQTHVRIHRVWRIMDPRKRLLPVNKTALF